MRRHNLQSKEQKISFLKELAKGNKSLNELRDGSAYSLKQIPGKPDSFIFKKYLHDRKDDVKTEILTVVQLKNRKFNSADALYVIGKILKHDIHDIIKWNLFLCLVVDEKTVYELRHLKKQYGKHLIKSVGFNGKVKTSYDLSVWSDKDLETIEKIKEESVILKRGEED